ncbi:tripartite tricarboxylate transporter substrate binding protein [Pigmentiphaga soli]|uniref:Tripartite tricarboxylate transporter substrate binding protein n=1 Tax=Pigmentiphaga soli TaxID=1007095 RepID=A0ABP8H4Z9_9BURK
MITLQKKSWCTGVGGAVLACSLLAAGSAMAESADSFPSRPIRVVSGFAPGGGTDVAARIISQPMSARLNGQSVVVDNKPGAAGNIAADFVARSAPDGYTLYLNNATIAMPSMFNNLPFDARKDFAAVSLIGYAPSVLVINPKVLSVRSVKELLDYAKKNPGKLNYASGGVGNITHMAMELLISMTGIDVVHVPYKGGAPSVNAIVAGEVPMGFASATSTLGQIRQGTLLPLAVSSKTRVQALPDVPTLDEAGVKGYESSSWYGLLAPAATPKPIVEKLGNAVRDALKNKELRDKLLAQGLEPPEGGPAEFASYMSGEFDKWEAIIKKSNIKAE